MSIFRTIIRQIKRVPLFGSFLQVCQQFALRVFPKMVILWLYRDVTDWKKLEADITDFLASDRQGTAAQKRDFKVIISLTSYPPRIPLIHRTIYTLLTQSVKPNVVILWLAEEQFPNRDNDLTPEILAMKTHGFEIRYTRDIKSYKKLVPALKAFPNDVIVTVDDDVLYHPEMLERLLVSYERDPSSVHCHRAYRIALTRDNNVQKYRNWKFYQSNQGVRTAYDIFFTGVGGVLYPPQVLHADALNETQFMRLCPMADDIWFWAMAVLGGAKICLVEQNISPQRSNSPITYEEITHGSGLMIENVFGGRNDVQLQSILAAYPVVLERIVSGEY